MQPRRRFLGCILERNRRRHLDGTTTLPHGRVVQVRLAKACQKRSGVRRWYLSTGSPVVGSCTWTDCGRSVRRSNRGERRERSLRRSSIIHAVLLMLDRDNKLSIRLIDSRSSFLSLARVSRARVYSRGAVSALSIRSISASSFKFDLLANPCS